ncbi:phosphomethylpyrimidine synthase [Candidatus Desantisbacteria bacterium CG2_30_40_21]|uniref:Phosphomethylpyrimidine synthase n=6 Tax=unclassified Candidatus Desantisiibacteriota TaxID=3106372 RepID=A0A2M7JCR7_9BACT|nr:MAG: phosphomethylpyrimidine synthase [Candidatus Desantisbacteria bacterium CG2_30_40_21]PIP40180.1 MAG: phosphomethylpyrimidine synthase [Candidatus Desantisbacteria bacterium CG23_combo_of_CG06-09_8_20_14_all_40_23]PIX17209.1 MAG: phosphomethylpyrimidine synthase [Candidatus Desantisbacteria bacterium CG_4_8_14_3_um_filter_40_12]PIY19798.1 MAG: phosphomethylpyrimidine synthase [Candidatus Desantisbacteria bacterium CG_4_10_14_3_um_filter_40_18]
MTQLQQAISGIITDEVRFVADSEGRDIEFIRQGIAVGRIVIPHNINHRINIYSGIGEGLRTKVNANIGTSPQHIELDEEIKKAETAIAFGADAIMDLSIAGETREIRKTLLKKIAVPFGTVPIYEAALNAVERDGSIMSMTPESILEVIARQAEDGVDFITIHSGVTQLIIERLKQQGRCMDTVSRGGTFIVEWMLYHNRENPFYERFDDILHIAKQYDVVLSLGDGLRPGCLMDATDRPQIQELIILGELAKRAYEAQVQVMIEGPGHVPMNQITANVLLQKQLCNHAPFYVLGPLVTDIAPGYDHITAAIGGAIAAGAGADFLCYVTPSEHLNLPTIEDVKNGVIAARIAAHAGDIAKQIPGAFDRDIQMAKARAELDWKKQAECSVDPDRVNAIRGHIQDDTCGMCGSFCAIKMVRERLQKAEGKRSK